MEYYIWMAGSLTLLILGSIHLIYTFFTNKFSTRNPALEEEMKVSSPVLTNETTMWKAWIGFNGSHSSGVIYFGLVNFYLAAMKASILFNPVLILVNFGAVSFYLWLAIKYWFSIPLKGICIAFVLFVISIALILVR